MAAINPDAASHASGAQGSAGLASACAREAQDLPCEALHKRPLFNIARFDLNLLVVLNAIASEGSITRASTRLNLSQPAVSHALARLRAALNDPLFVRTHKGMTPTPTARAILAPIRHSLNEIEMSLNELDKFDASTSRRSFRIGMRHAIEAMVLPRLAARLVGLRSEVTLTSVNHTRRSLQQDLLSGDLDIAVDVPLPQMPSIAATPVGSTQLIVVCREAHPLLAQAQQLDLQSYLSLEHILVSSRSNGPALEDMALAALKQHRKVVLRCANPWTALQTVACTDLVTPLHVAELQDFQRPLRTLKAFEAPFGNVGTSLVLYCSESRKAEKPMKWIRDQIIDCLARAPRG